MAEGEKAGLTCIAGMDGFVGASAVSCEDVAVGSGAKVAVVAGKRIELRRFLVSRRSHRRHLEPGMEFV
jgi:hypothetical protein